eukprot:Nitzschia sp. Nitz4//scaffold144_size56818//48568//50020//NITZ4_006547-RA/size56818-snap-gene-0.7-mRNA-1//1//CDS//3329536546//3585//frame0
MPDFDQSTNSSGKGSISFKPLKSDEDDAPIKTIDARSLQWSEHTSTSVASSLALSEEDVLDEDGEILQCHLRRIANRRRWELQDSVLDCIGQTPIVRLQRMAPPGVNVYVKCENFNPGGSLKDRLAIGIIEWAEYTGKLKPGMTVIEASSGNTGVGLALVCAAKGYPFICVMSESFSIERRKLMRFLGARVVLTPKIHKSTGMLIKAQELADKHGFFYAKQFENEANAWMHEQTTGREIIDAFDRTNRHLDHFFMSYGSGGTVLGVSRAFKERSPDTVVHLCEPTNAPMVASHIKTKYPKSGVPSTSFDAAHPAWNPHQLQGWATDFIPKLVSIARKENCYQEIEHVNGTHAIATAQRLAKEEGIFCGISGGGILSAALKYAETCQPGTNVLAMIADTGERYLSTDLFANIPTEMSEEELALSMSTEGRAPPAPSTFHGIFPANTDELFDL